jgi:excisionase family DNA binding protein
MPDLTVSDVAAELQLSEWTVRLLLRRGDLGGYRLTGKRGQWRVTSADLQALRQRGRAG